MLKDAHSLLRNWVLFLREALAHPRSIGAVFPSSPALAQRMASCTAAQDTFVIELGAGTGVVTEALLARGIAPSRLLAVERSANLAKLLRHRFPTVPIVCGDAAQLRSLLPAAAQNGSRVDVVSSLPLRSLPGETVRLITSEIAAVVGRSGRWVQFTYSLASRKVPSGFVRDRSTFVWLNVPPARVDIFTMPTQPEPA